MAVSLDSHPVKDLAAWTPLDVREFLESVLPGHPCVDNFRYTSGYVLDNLQKDDVRRQARDEEAANIIWAELKGSRGRAAAASQRGARAAPAGAAAPSFAATAGLERSLPSSAGVLTLYVRTRQEVALEFDALSSDTVGALKEAIAAREGTPPESQRLVANGVSMQDDRTLASYRLRHGAHLLLVPQLRDQGKSVPRTFAPRGILMVPGSSTWRPKGAEQRPYLPVLCNDVSLGFPVSLTFDCSKDADVFVASRHAEAPMLEIQPAGPQQVPLETRLSFHPDTGSARLENCGDILQPGAEYTAFIRYNDRGGHTRVTLQTGADVL